VYAGEAAIALDRVQYAAGRGHPARHLAGRPVHLQSERRHDAEIKPLPRYPVTELPGTLQRSCREAQETFLRALDDAVRTHGAGDQAHRIAYLALKQKFEKRGDHWIAKDKPADCGGRESRSACCPQEQQRAADPAAGIVTRVLSRRPVPHVPNGCLLSWAVIGIDPIRRRPASGDAGRAVYRGRRARHPGQADVRLNVAAGGRLLAGRQLRAELMR
jgi:hypothetical protein